MTTASGCQGSAKTGRVLHRDLSPTQRRAALDALPELRKVASTGWRFRGETREDLREQLYAEARRCHIGVWPTLVRNLLADVCSEPRSMNPYR